MTDEYVIGENASKPGLLRRVIAFPLTLLVIGFVWFMVFYGLASTASARVLQGYMGPAGALVALLFAGFAVISYKLYKRWIERKTDEELNLAGSLREIGIGLLFGFVLFSTAVGVVALMGGFEVLGLRGEGQFWEMLVIAILSGVYEEVLFRGVIFRHLEAMLGSWVALAITSALFGAAHLANPGATAFAAVAIAVEAGMMLGAAYMLTRRLWLAIGIHAAWNFTQGWVFSIPVSGGNAPLGLLITRRVGPDWLTGGEFGLEASVVAMVLATLAGLILLRRAILAGQFKRPMWAR